MQRWQPLENQLPVLYAGENPEQRSSAMSTTETVETTFLEPEEFRRMHSGGRSSGRKPPRDKVQRQQRAEMILNHYQLLWKYADANDKVSSNSHHSCHAARSVH